MKLIVEHIRTSAGARFATYTSDEDRRVQLIQYYNEVHTGDGVDEFPDDASLEEVEGAIEEIEDIDVEEIWIDVEAPPDLVAAGDTLADLVEEALTVHIYDPQNDEMPSAHECPYRQGIAAWRAATGAAQGDGS